MIPGILRLLSILYFQDVTGPPQPRRGYTQHSSGSKEPRPRYGYHDLKAGAVTSPTDSLKSPLGSSMRISVQGSQEMLAKVSVVRVKYTYGMLTAINIW